MFWIGLALICGSTALTGAVPTRIYGHDIFFLLDNGWRVINGQRPHVDYSSGWGPITFLVTAAGLELAGYAVDGIGYGNALVAVLIGIWSFFLTKNRLTPPLRLLLSLFLAALVAAPHPLGTSAFLSSHAMVYNRYGYALLGLIVAETFRASDRAAPTPTSTEDWMGGLSSGAALGLTLFLKASFFLVELGVVIVLSAFCRRVTMRRIAGVCLGGLATGLVLLAYLHFDAPAMLGDLRMAAAARSETLSLWIPLINAVNHIWFFMGVLVFSTASAMLLDRRPAAWRGWQLPVAGAFFFCVDIALMSSNAQGGALPVIAVFVILVASAVMDDHRTITEQRTRSVRMHYAAALCIGPLLCIPLFLGDLTAIAYGLWDKLQAASPTMARFTTSNLRHLILYDNDEHQERNNGRVYTTYVNDGVALLDRSTRPNDKVLTMDMVNPFPYAMERPPPRGGIAAMAYHYTLSDNHRPTYDEYFGDADIVMVPSTPASLEEFYADFWKAYEPGLRERFELAEETDLWSMYRRRPKASMAQTPKSTNPRAQQHLLSQGLER